MAIKTARINRDRLILPLSLLLFPGGLFPRGEFLVAIKTARINRDRLILPLSLLLFLGACFHSRVQPRPADMLEEGETSFRASVDLGGVASGVVDGVYGEDGVNPGTDSGNSAQASSFPDGYVFDNLVFELRHAFFEQNELALIAGVRQSGLEVRQGVTDEDSHSAFSAAFSVAGGWEPRAEGPWTRTGVDVSKRYGPVAPFVNLYGSWGVVDHAFNVSNRPECAGFGQPGCGEMSPLPHYTIRRYELQLHGAGGLGVFISQPDRYDLSRNVSIALLTIALQPYVTLWSGAPSVLDCSSCLGGPPSSFKERAGVFLNFGVNTWPSGAPPTFPTEN